MVTNLVISNLQNAGIPVVMADDVWVTAAYDYRKFGRISGDLNGDCLVDITDIQAVASRWRVRLGDKAYNVVYDLDFNSRINIVDVMSVVAEWGSACE